MRGGAARNEGPTRGHAESLRRSPRGEFGDRRHVFWANGVRTVANSDPSSLASNLIYHGGAIQKSPKVYLTFWGKEWTDSSISSYTIPVKDPQAKPYTLARLQAYITKFMKGLGGTGWNNIQTQYCQGGQIGDLSCGTGTVAVTNAKSLVAGVWNDGVSTDEPAPVIDTLGLAENVVTDPVATEALRASDHFGSTDPDATFFVFLPPGRWSPDRSPMARIAATTRRSPRLTAVASDTPTSRTSSTPICSRALTSAAAG